MSSKFLHTKSLLFIALPAVLVGIFSAWNAGLISFSPAPSTTNSSATGPTHPKDAVQFDLYRQGHPKTMEVPLAGPWKAIKALARQNRISIDPIKYKKDKKDGRWQQVNDFFTTLSITGVAHDPINSNTLYFCTGEGWFNSDAVRGAGVWKSTDAGKTWNQLSSTDNSTFYWCQDIAVDNIGYIYVATRNDGLQRSKDGGQTWKKVLGAGQQAGTNRAADIEITANGGLFCTMGIFNTDGVYYSPTGEPGDWTRQTNGFPTSGIYRIELATAPSNDSVAYASVVNTDYYIKGFYKTINKGQEWFEINIPGGDSTEFARRQGWYDLIVEVAPHDEDVVVAGGLDLWRSRDGGYNWIRLSDGQNRAEDTGRPQYVHVDQHEVVFQSPDTVYFGNDGGIWKTDNFTDSMPDIYNKNKTYNVTQYYTTAIHPKAGHPAILGGTQDNGSSMAADTGISKFRHITGADGAFCEIHPHNPDTFYTSKQNGIIFRFLNGPEGVHDTIYPPYEENDSLLFINPFKLEPNNPEILYTGTHHGLWRLNNASSAPNSGGWERASKDIGVVSAIGVTQREEHIVFIGRRVRSSFGTKNVKLFRIENGDPTSGNSTTKDADPLNQLPSGQLIHTSSIYVDPNDGNHVIVTFSNYGVTSVFESKNALSDTATWQPVEGNLPDIPVYWSLLHPNNKNVCYIATEIGVFYTEDLNGSNTNWQPTNNGLANVRTDMLRYRSADRTIVAATHGRGMFTSKIPTDSGQYELQWQERGPNNVGGRTRSIMIDPTDASNKSIWAASVSGGLWHTDNIDSIPPMYKDYPTDTPSTDTPDYHLAEYNFTFKAYPNPFDNQGLNFYFSIPFDTRTQLLLFDNSGRIVTEIFNKDRQKGEYKHHWQPPSSFTDGIYYAMLRVGKKQKWITLTHFNTQ